MIPGIEANQTLKVSGIGLIKTGIIEIGKHVWNGAIKNTRNEKIYNSDNNITHQCIKSMAETELNIDGSKSIKKLILE